MKIWQVDFYKRPFENEKKQRLWELVIIEENSDFFYQAFCPQSEANSSWVVTQLQHAQNGQLPTEIQVFRPQTLNLVEIAGKQLNIPVEPNRHCHTLKNWLVKESKNYSVQENYLNEPFDPLALDRPPPAPMPEHLLGQQWRFAALPAGDLVDAFRDRPIPILKMSEYLWPVNLGLPSTLPIPGIIIDGGRQSLRLAQWIQQVHPVSLNYVSGSPDGLILEAGLIERWIVATFEDKDVAKAAQVYQQRQKQSQGLHFLLVQPDDSGMTYSGFWLLQSGE